MTWEAEVLGVGKSYTDDIGNNDELNLLLLLGDKRVSPTGEGDSKGIGCGLVVLLVRLESVESEPGLRPTPIDCDRVGWCFSFVNGDG